MSGNRRRSPLSAGTGREIPEAGVYGGHPTKETAPWQRGKRDRRYGLGKYQRFRERVLRRDNWTCWYPGCPRRGDVLDHIIPTYPGMPDDLFFSEANARAACAHHNRARGWKTYADRELGTAGASRVITGDYSIGRQRR